MYQCFHLQTRASPPPPGAPINSRPPQPRSHRGPRRGAGATRGGETRGNREPIWRVAAPYYPLKPGCFSPRPLPAKAGMKSSSSPGHSSHILPFPTPLLRVNEGGKKEGKNGEKNGVPTPHDGYEGVYPSLPRPPCAQERRVGEVGLRGISGLRGWPGCPCRSPVRRRGGGCAVPPPSRPGTPSLPLAPPPSLLSGSFQEALRRAAAPRSLSHSELLPPRPWQERQVVPTASPLSTRQKAPSLSGLPLQERGEKGFSPRALTPRPWPE